VSYSHDSAQHKSVVLALSERLRGDGIECVIDQYVQSPKEGWPRWMVRRVKKADFVLVVCTEHYRRRFELEEQKGKGRGAKWEGAVITQQLYDADGHNSRFIPILLHSRETDIPLILRGATYYDLTDGKDYESLYRLLTGQPRVVPKPVGTDLVPMPPEKEAPEELEAYFRSGGAAIDTGQFEEARAAFQDALELAEGGGYVAETIRAKIDLATVLWYWDRKPEAAREMLEACLGELRGTGYDKERAWALFQLGTVMGVLGDHDQSRSLLQQARDLDRKLGRTLHEAQTVVQLGWEVRHLGASEDVLELNEEALQRFLGIYHSGDPKDRDHSIQGVAGCYFQRAKVYQREGKVADAEAALTSSLEWLRKRARNHDLAIALREMAELQFHRQNMQRGIECLQEAGDIFQSLGHHLEVARCMDIMGRVHFTFGRRRDAAVWLEAAAATASKTEDDEEAAKFLLKTGELRLNHGETGEAKQLFEQARDGAGDDGAFRAACLSALADVAGLEEKPGERKSLLREAVDSASAFLATIQAPPRRAEVLGEIGFYHQAMEEYEEALAYTQKAHEVYCTTSSEYGIVQTLAAIAHLKGCLGRVDEQRKAYEEVRKRVEGTEFHEVIAVADINLSDFEERDGNYDAAKRLLESAEGVCRKHRLPFLDQVVLRLDRIETSLSAERPPDLGMGDLVDEIYGQLSICPQNKDGYLRYWTFSRGPEFMGNLKGSIGLNLMVVEEELSAFTAVATALAVYVDWSFLAVPSEYPENIHDVIPLTEKMHIYASTAAICFKQGDDRSQEAWRDLVQAVQDKKVDLRDLNLPDAILYQGMSTGGTLPRYFWGGDGNEPQGHCISGWSPALPPQYHQLVFQSDAEETKRRRIFFMCYYRAKVDDPFLADLGMGRAWRLLPVYRSSLPRSDRVQLVASCPITLPVLSSAAADTSSTHTRRVKQGLMQLLSCSEESAANALNQLALDAGELADAVRSDDSIDLQVYLLKWTNESGTGIHPAILMKGPNRIRADGSPAQTTN